MIVDPPDSMYTGGGGCPASGFWRINLYTYSRATSESDCNVATKLADWRVHTPDLPSKAVLLPERSKMLSSVTDPIKPETVILVPASRAARVRIVTEIVLFA